MSDHDNPRWKNVFDGKLPMPTNWYFGDPCTENPTHNHKSGQAIRRKASKVCIACENIAIAVPKSKYTRKRPQDDCFASQADKKREQLAMNRMMNNFHFYHLEDI